MSCYTSLNNEDENQEFKTYLNRNFSHSADQKEDTDKILQATCDTLQIIETYERKFNEKVLTLTITQATDNHQPESTKKSKDDRRDSLEKPSVERTDDRLEVKVEGFDEQRRPSTKTTATVTATALQTTTSTTTTTITRTTEAKLEKQSTEEEKHVNGPADDDKECTSIISAISNEESSINSDILDHKSFCPRKNSDGEDVNGHIGHIDSPETDTYPNSEALHGESLVDDISSMLGNDLCGYDSMENTYTDDTTLFTSEFSDIKHERRKSMKRDSLDRRRRSSCTKIDEDTQFGFENRAFMTQHIILENKFDADQPKYCSLAQFVEGNDIARKSIKRGRSSKLSKTEANVNRQSTLTEESENSTRGSRTSLNKIEKEMSNLKETGTPIEVKEEISEMDGAAGASSFPQVSVIVEPPSPDLNEQIRVERMEKISIEVDEDYDLRTLGGRADRLSTGDVSNSNNSSNSNLLGIDNEHFLSCSPAATRRISCCSMLNSNEAAILAAAAATSKFYTEEHKNKEKKEDKESEKKQLPIINPLVRLPSWPSKFPTINYFSNACSVVLFLMLLCMIFLYVEFCIIALE